MIFACLRSFIFFLLDQIDCSGLCSDGCPVFVIRSTFAHPRIFSAHHHLRPRSQLDGGRPTLMKAARNSSAAHTYLEAMTMFPGAILFDCWRTSLQSKLSQFTRQHTVLMASPNPLNRPLVSCRWRQTDMNWHDMSCAREWATRTWNSPM